MISVSRAGGRSWAGALGLALLAGAGAAGAAAGWAGLLFPDPVHPWRLEPRRGEARFPGETAAFQLAFEDRRSVQGLRKAADLKAGFVILQGRGTDPASPGGTPVGSIHDLEPRVVGGGRKDSWGDQIELRGDDPVTAPIEPLTVEAALPAGNEVYGRRGEVRITGTLFYPVPQGSQFREEKLAINRAFPVAFATRAEREQDEAARKEYDKAVSEYIVRSQGQNKWREWGFLAALVVGVLAFGAAAFRLRPRPPGPI